MADNIRRRDFLKLAALFAATTGLHLTPVRGGVMGGGAQPESESRPRPGQSSEDAQNRYALNGLSNFKAIYGRQESRDAFLLFLTNVFNLYPEAEFHELIADVSSKAHTDKEIYQLVHARLGTIKPIFSEIRYALPALAKQKAEMARQTRELLGAVDRVDGYLEVGSTGRYLSRLRKEVEIKGDIVLVHTEAPSYSPVDLVERGRLFKSGRFVPLNDYAPVVDVDDGSLDLVTNYIGFHHAPLDKRDAFVASLRRALRPGGRLILRDHDVDSDRMNHMVALAHDVFNMGTDVDWSVNQREVRHFTAMADLIPYLEGFGFRCTHKLLYQSGDPTRNALLEFVKI